MKVTNYTKAKQGVYVAKGLKFVDAGESKEFDVSGDEATELKNHPAFQKDGKVPVILAETEPFTEDEEKPEADEVEETDEEKAEETKDVSEKDDLIAKLAELGVTADKRSSVATLTAKLEEAKAAQ